MLTLNTNHSSQIAYNSLRNSTNLLSKAVERLTTGYKINHVADNAANFSISTTQTTKLSAYRVAEDNVSMGLDLLSTASNSLELISKHLSRIRDLAVQASNGTYDGFSVSDMCCDVYEKVDEINRLYNTTEYNGVKVFDNQSNDTFIKEVIKRDTSEMITLASIDEGQNLAVGTYSISTAEELAKLATMTNNGLVADGSEFVLAADIDLGKYTSGNGWASIGCTEDVTFRGIFDGNGFVISNLFIDTHYDIDDCYGVIWSDSTNTGLFGFFEGDIKNVGLEDVNINTDNNTGALVTFFNGGTCSNCYSTGNIIGIHTGGLIGFVNLPWDFAKRVDISDCFSRCDVKSIRGDVGGLIGTMCNGSISNSYANGSLGYFELQDTSIWGGLVAVKKQDNTEKRNLPQSPRI